MQSLGDISELKKSKFLKKIPNTQYTEVIQESYNNLNNQIPALG